MELTWRARLLQEPELGNIQRWPFVDPHALTQTDRTLYFRNLRIVTAVLDGQKLQDVAQSTQVSMSWVSQLMKRCLAGDEDSPPALSAGLIPHQHVRQSKRKTQLGTLTEPRGARCSFQSVLHSVPGLYSYLMKQIKRSVNHHRRGQNLTAKAFHASFINYLRTAGWEQDTYPFNHPSLGAESCRRFLIASVLELQMSWGSSRVIGSKIPPVGAFQEIHIDEAHLDCHGAAAVVLHGQMKPVRLGRISLLLARDVATGCYLGATFALSAHPNAADVLGLLEQLIQPWEPPKLTTPGLAYPSAIGFPSALDEAFCRPAFGVIRFDNALAHLSHQVRRMVCDHLAATTNLGLPKNPKARACIEQAFKKLNVDIHRLPSTTGSHPTDVRREPGRLKKEPPFVSLRALEEAVTVLLIEHNHRPLANMGGISPIDQMRYQMANHLLPLRASNPVPGLGPYERSQQAVVRKGFTADEPRINFEGCQYTGAAINAAQLINQKVTIVFDIRDIRQLKVSTLSGEGLGEVYVSGTWMRYPHSVSMRKRANRLVRDHVLSRSDPMGGFVDYMLAHCHLPREALSLMRFTDSISQPAVTPSEKPGKRYTKTTNNPALAQALSELPDWSPAMVKKRR